MKHIKTTLLFFLVVTGVNNMNAQFSQLRKSPWVIGIGANIVDDSGKRMGGLMNAPDNWNILPYPSQISIEKYLTNGLSFEAIAAINELKVGNTLNGKEKKKDLTNSSSMIYILDGNFNYHLNDFFSLPSWFDPYVLLGYGMTMNDNSEDNPTTNLGVGACTWIKKRVGIKFQAVGKWTLADATSNYKYYSIGLVFKLGGPKENETDAKRHLRSILDK